MAENFGYNFILLLQYMSASLVQYSLSSQYDGVLYVSLQWELNAKRGKEGSHDYISSVGGEYF